MIYIVIKKDNIYSGIGKLLKDKHSMVLVKCLQGYHQSTVGFSLNEFHSKETNWAGFNAIECPLQSLLLDT